MSAFSVEEFVRDVRAAAAGEDAATGVRQLMDAAFADPAAVAEGMSGFKGEDEVLFEDDTVSIWYCGLIRRNIFRRMTIRRTRSSAYMAVPS